MSTTVIPVTTSTSTAVTATTVCGPGFITRLYRNIPLDGEPPRCTKKERNALWAFRMRQEGKLEHLSLIGNVSIVTSIIGVQATVVSAMAQNGYMLIGMLAISVVSIHICKRVCSIESMWMSMLQRAFYEARIRCMTGELKNFSKTIYGVSSRDAIAAEGCLSEADNIALRRLAMLIERIPMDKVASLRLDGDARELLARATSAIGQGCAKAHAARTEVEIRVEASKLIGAPNGMITGRSLMEGASTE